LIGASTGPGDWAALPGRAGPRPEHGTPGQWIWLVRLVSDLWKVAEENIVTGARIGEQLAALGFAVINPLIAVADRTGTIGYSVIVGRT
jgi:hypothetical protein